jgi:hypothetical protein
MQEARVLDALNAFREDPDNLARAEAVANSPHAREQFAIAAKYLRRFFADKNGRNGKEVSEQQFISVDHLSTVLNTAMCPGIDMFYAILAARGEDHGKDWDIKYLVSVLHECRALKIPQNLIAGVACVHAQIVGCWQKKQVSIFAMPLDDVDEEEEIEDVEPDDFELEMVEKEYAEVA